MVSTTKTVPDSGLRHECSAFASSSPLAGTKRAGPLPAKGIHKALATAAVTEIPFREASIHAARLIGQRPGRDHQHQEARLHAKQGGHAFTPAPGQGRA